MHEVLETSGLHAGLLGTVKQVVGGLEEEAIRTTGEAIDLQQTFVRMLEVGDRACVMEVSSHALELGRADGITFAVKVFTNLTQDHLDFHPDMEAYYLAKRRLFDLPGPAVVNLDDEYGLRLAGELGDATTFAIEAGPTPTTGPRHPLRRDRRGVHRGHPGRRGGHDHAAARPVQRVQRAGRLHRRPGHGRGGRRRGQALADAARVPGRFEPVEEGQAFGVLIDYAHTPDSLENVLRAARELTEGTLHVVFGAGGDRDKAKRPLMGKAAADHADRLVVTSDNPRSEDPDAIVDQVMEGTGPGAEREVDRREAIARPCGRGRRRRGGHRRQGPRAGPGVRGRPQGAFDDVRWPARRWEAAREATSSAP